MIYWKSVFRTASACACVSVITLYAIIGDSLFKYKSPKFNVPEYRKDK